MVSTRQDIEPRRQSSTPSSKNSLADAAGTSRSRRCCRPPLITGKSYHPGERPCRPTADPAGHATGLTLGDAHRRTTRLSLDKERVPHGDQHHSTTAGATNLTEHDQLGRKELPRLNHSHQHYLGRTGVATARPTGQPQPEHQNRHPPHHHSGSHRQAGHRAVWQAPPSPSSAATHPRSRGWRSLATSLRCRLG